MEIKCEFYTTSSKHYRCRVTKAAITKPNVDIASFKGDHEPGKNNDDVTEVNFHNAIVEHFPRNLPKIFPNLNTLQIFSCDLKEIFREDLIGLEKLVELTLSCNELKSLPDDLFSNMPNLKYVCLDRNGIEFVSSKLIEPIVGNQLEHFGLQGANINAFYKNGDDRDYGSSEGCRTIQELMAKIDEKCKPPTPQTRPQPITATAKCDSSRCHAEKIFKDFNEHRLLGRFTDFVIIVGSKEFPAHKSILATQSPVLAEIFEVKTDGRFASKLEISDSSAEGVEAFLEHIYEQKLPDARNAVETLKLATKYKVAKLKTICEGIIQENLDESNAFEIFKLACGPHKSEKLKVAAFGKLQEKFGGKLNNDLIDDPEKLQKIVEAFLVIVEAKKVFDDLMNEPRAKKQRLA